MELFTNTLFITFGVLAAVALAWMAAGTVKVAIDMLLHMRYLQLEKKDREERTANADRTKKHFHDLALEALENPEVKEILEALVDVPYVDKHTKGAKKQNYERQKLQAKLRKLVTDGNIREAIYNMTA